MKKNFLTLGKELRDALRTTKDNIWNNTDNFCYGDRKQGFKRTYADAEWYINTIYDVCDDVLDCFGTYDNFATQVKNAFLTLGEWVYSLAEYSQNALNDTYSYFLTKIAPDDDKYYHTRDLANGEEELYYIEPTFDDFMENITDCEYTYDYEDWNNTEEAVFVLSEDILGYTIWNYAFDMYTATQGGDK